LLYIIFKSMKQLAIWDKFIDQQLVHIVHIVHTDALITAPQRLIAVQGVYMDMNLTEPNCY